MGYCYWDITNEQKEELRRQGGQQLALRVYDATDIDLNYQPPHSIQEYPCDELAREWYLPIPVSDRDYAVEIGYRCADGRWLVLARSLTVHTPPVYPSDWIEDIFVTVNWDEPLVGKTVATLVPPAKNRFPAKRTSAIPSTKKSSGWPNPPKHNGWQVLSLGRCTKSPNKRSVPLSSPLVWECGLFLPCPV